MESVLVVFWGGEAVGEITEVCTETFHLSGRWKPRDSRKVKSFLRCFEVEDPEVVVGLGDASPWMKGRMYEAPDEFIDVNIIPDSA